MKQVTIIVPIYNVENYLRTCFESLLKQTSKEYEVLAVNDGSPDNSQAIIEEYAAKYPDLIHAVQKENGGYGSVLELAIQTIDTPYFLVCDPDDTLEPNAVETLLNLAKVSGADLTVGAKTFVYENSRDEDYDKAYNGAYVTLKPNTIYRKGSERYDDLFFIDPSPHAKLYKKALSEKIRFPKKVGYTDNLLFYINLISADSVIYTDVSLADYLIDRAGNSMGDISVKAMRGEIEVFKSILKQAEALGDVPDIFYYRMYESFKFMLYKTRRVQCTKREYVKILDQLEGFLQSLLKHSDVIIHYYRKYTKVKILERFRDELLLRDLTQKRTYASLKKKMADAFEEKVDEAIEKAKEA